MILRLMDKFHSVYQFVVCKSFLLYSKLHTTEPKVTLLQRWTDGPIFFCYKGQFDAKCKQKLKLAEFDDLCMLILKNK